VRGENKKAFGGVSVLSIGLVAYLIIFLVLLMLYFTVWPIVKMAFGFLA